ncbi:hypothetical protein CDAR_417641 [Caerostris darwini]|uniref:ribonuclease H n=1 Tax=Caerostris darwini TaxID=1538125 RepID=A0AAV4V9S1_9ARAC|nr:hypothetical protein CDAR_417641 [Caerostris darwini]
MDCIERYRRQVTINDITIQPHSITFRKPILKPWTKISVTWNHAPQNLQGTLIYTDGSKLNDRVGGAFVVFQQGEETYSQTFRLSDSATVFMAELVAIDNALDFAIEQSLSPANIISDSRSVLLALENLNNLDPSILNIKNKILNFTGQVRLYWIKAHAGHMGNERADVLAKEATTNPDIQLPVVANLQYFKQLLKKEILAEWQDRWSNSSKGREVFLLLPKVNINRVQGDFYINQLISGHGALAAYQLRFFGKAAECTCGHPLEDRMHLIYDCPQWDNFRQKFFPTNFKTASIDLLLFNHKSRNGLREIMKHKLQSLLSSIDNDIISA